MKIIIIGSGIAGITFAEKFRSHAPNAEITLLTKEIEGYYSRPLLSHGFSRENIEQTIILKTFDSLREKKIKINSGVEVSDIDRNAHRVTTKRSEDYESFEYDKLILALGSAALIPPPFRPYQELFFVLNSLGDLKKIRKFRQPMLELNHPPHWAIIGGGLIGCELASDLAVSGDQVTLFHGMDRLMERQLEEEDSSVLLTVLESSGIKVLLERAVQGFEKHNGKIGVFNQNFDGVIVSCGFKPRIEVATKSGLEVNRGITVNPYLQTSDEAIYALGDVAELPNGKLYAFIMPIRSQATWLAGYLSNQDNTAWQPPAFNPKAKVHGFEATHPYIF